MEIEPLDRVPQAPPQPPPVTPREETENGQQPAPEPEDSDRIIDVFA
jgi:hypothetical protein